MKNIPVLFLMLFSLVGKTQISNDLSLLQHTSTNKISALKEFEYANSYNNEIEFILSKSFLFYKKHVSSQDISSCNFTPSCSEYAFKAIKKQGILLGYANFFDRFTRCNGLNAENYQFQFDKKLFYDPVRNFKGVILEDEKLPD